MGRRVMRLMAWMGCAVLLVSVGAMAQPRRGGDGDDEGGRRGLGQRGRVMFNGREDAELSRESLRDRNDILIPSDRLFQRLGGQEQRERGWRPPGGSDRDRDQEWTVVKRGDRELRFRPGSREYWWGGQRHYWSREPYRYGGRLYISLGDIIRLFGGSYRYDGRYGYGYATLCEYGYCAGYDEIRLIYPREGQTFYREWIPVQGYVAPYRNVRITIYREGPYYAYSGRQVFSDLLHTGRSGLFETEVRIRNEGAYRILAELRDGRGNTLARESNRFYVR